MLGIFLSCDTAADSPGERLGASDPLLQIARRKGGGQALEQ